MTREQAINYLISSGFSEEQVSEVVRALTYEPTTKKCTTCAYREIDGKPHEMCKSCVCGDRYREDPTTKNDLGAERHKQNLQAYAHDFGVSEEQAEKELAVKNDLGVDCISRQDVLSEIIRFSTEEGASVECQQLYCDVNNMPSVIPQDEPFKPMVEIDLYSVIKQKYFEREALDKIRAEIEPTRKMYLEMNDIDWLNGCDYVLSVIDKYKAEQEKT